MRGPAVNRDLCGGVLFVIVGLVVLIQGRTYGIGSLTDIGAGFFPVILGVALVVLGALIASSGLWSDPAATKSADVSLPKADLAPLEWRGIVAVVAGVGAFIAIGALFGLAPAAFCCVFISALGDRSTTITNAALLAVAMTAFAVCFFCYVLSIQFPIFQSPMSWVNP